MIYKKHLNLIILTGILVFTISAVCLPIGNDMNAQKGSF